MPIVFQSFTGMNPIKIYHSFFSKSAVGLLFIQLIIWSIPVPLISQSLSHRLEQFTGSDGLPYESVLDFAQDQHGFIWIATMSGLAKYDGYKFFSYNYIPGDSTSINSEGIESLFVDSKGVLWVGTRLGLNRYEPGCDCFQRYDSSPRRHESLGQEQVNAFAEDQFRNLWIGTQEGSLFRYLRDSNRFDRFLHDPNALVTVNNDEIRELLIDRHNKLWIGTGEPFDPKITGGGLIRFDPKTHAAKRFLHDPDDSHSLIDNRVTALFEDQKGRLLIGTCQSGLHYFDREKDVVFRLDIDLDQAGQLHAPVGDFGLYSSCPHVKILHQDRSGGYWIGTFNGGLHHFQEGTNELQRYTAGTDGFVNNMFQSFFEDRQGRYWISSFLGPLYKLDPTLNKFNTYTHDPANRQSLGYNDINWLYESPSENQVIWISTRGRGLDRLDRKTGQFTHFRHAAGNPHSLNHDVVWATYEDSQEVFWVGTEKGLEQMDSQTGTFKPFVLRENDRSRPNENAVLRIREDRSGIMWFGTWNNGVYRYDRQQGSIDHYTFSEGPIQTHRNSISIIHEDRYGAIWVSTWLGALFRYEPETDTFKPVLDKFGFNYIYEDERGHFWIGSENGGLLDFNPADGAFRQFTMADGLPSNIITAIFEDDDGKFWLSTGNGISMFDPETLDFINYDESDGLPGNTFNRSGALKSSTGEIFFCGTEGLVHFFPEQVRGNTFPPDVLITDLRINDTDFSTTESNLYELERISLSHSENNLTFEYVGLHYSDPLRNRYKYKLQPYEEDWIDAEYLRSARYTNLDHGIYTFRVIASNSDGVWNEEGASLVIHIHPPWWKTWWAKLLFIVSITGSVMTYINWRTRNLRKRQVELEERVRDRTEEVVAQKETITREKERSEELLLNILPANIVEELKRDGKSPARHFEQVSVLFTDFKQFTKVSEKLTASELVSEIDICFKAFDKIIQKYGIEKIKTVGDAYMAATGLDPSEEKGAQPLILAALEMQQFIIDRQHVRKKEHMPFFEMRCGIHTGPVVAGIVGEKKFQYDIWGDTVNMAARMESSGEEGRVNISQSTYAIVKNDPNFEFISRGKIKAKNKGEVYMYYVNQVKAAD